MSGKRTVILLDPRMSIPCTPAPAAVKDLHETHPSFHEPAGRQAELAKRLGHVIIHAIELSSCLRLLFKLKCLGNRGLHAVGQFIRLDTSAQVRVVWIIDAC